MKEDGAGNHYPRARIEKEGAENGTTLASSNVKGRAFQPWPQTKITSQALKAADVRDFPPREVSDVRVWVQLQES